MQVSRAHLKSVWGGDDHCTMHVSRTHLQRFHGEHADTVVPSCHREHGTVAPPVVMCEVDHAVWYECMGIRAHGDPMHHAFNTPLAAGYTDKGECMGSRGGVV